MNKLSFNQNVQRNGLDNWINEFFNLNFNEPMNGIIKTTRPAVNVKETENAFVLELNVPGFKKEDFKIEVDKETLTISASTKKEELVENEKFTRREFVRNSVSRSFHLPENVNHDAIEANYEAGILILNLHKKEFVSPAKKIINLS